MERLRETGPTGLSLAGDGAGIWVAYPGRSVSVVAFVIGVVVHGTTVADSPSTVPELGWTAGSPAVLIGLWLLTAVVPVHFRWRGWL